MVTPRNVGGGKKSGTSKKKTLTSSSTARKRKSATPESTSRRQSPLLHQNRESLPLLPTLQSLRLRSLHQNIFDSIAEGREDDVHDDNPSAIAEGQEDEEVSPLKTPTIASSSPESSDGEQSADLLEKTQNTVIQESQCEEVVGTESQARMAAPMFELDDGAEEEFATDNVVDDHDPILDGAAADFSFPERMKHFLSPLLICDKSRQAVEMAILLEAGSIVSSEHVTNPLARNESLVLRYKECVQSLDDALFAPAIKEDMLQKRHNSRSIQGVPATLRGKQLWLQYDKTKCEMRKVFAA